MNQALVVLLLKSLVLSGLYFVFRSTYTKPWIIWMLAAEAFGQKTDYGKWIGFGLVLSSFGDIFLELDDEKVADLFIPGLVSFLIGHLLYIKGLRESFMKGYQFPLGALAIYLLVVTSQIVPKAEAMLKIPIVVYALVICTMVFYAINRAYNNQHSQMSQRFAVAGALVFAVSDTILALDRFHNPIANAKTWVMITYYSGQTLIAASTLNAAKAKKSA
ncbi:lysoplasmalogenase [archaeon]|nr:MAG: lysoplasmalogenase [archaeon]